MDIRPSISPRRHPADPQNTHREHLEIILVFSCKFIREFYERNGGSGPEIYVLNREET